MPITAPFIEPSELARLNSPAMIISRERLLSNLDAMLTIAGSPSRLRPHCKTHKMEQVIKLWLERGVMKHKAATIAECEMLAVAGATDVMLAYNPVGPNIERIVRLAAMFPKCQFSCTTDHESPLRQLSAACDRAKLASQNIRIGIWLDVNVGMDRTGITPESATALELCKLADTLPGLRLTSFHVYDGHRRESTLADRKAAVDASWPRVLDLRDRCSAAGLHITAMACGGTPTFPCYAAINDPAIELCPGTCVLHDSGYGTVFPDLGFSPAAFVVTRVVSRPAPNRMTLDIGNKAVAADPPKGSRIFLPDLPDAIQDIHSEEHMGLITPLADRYQPGDTLLAIPIHVCPTSALYDRVAVIENGSVADWWDVTSRNRRLTV